MCEVLQEVPVKLFYRGTSEGLWGRNGMFSFIYRWEESVCEMSVSPIFAVSVPLRSQISLRCVSVVAVTALKIFALRAVKVRQEYVRKYCVSVFVPVCGCKVLSGRCS